MGWYVQTIFVIVGFTFGSACKELGQGSKKKPATFQAPAGAATNADPGAVMNQPGPPKPAEPVVAKLSGYPDAKSPNSQFDISVTGVAEYKWKLVESATDCQISAGYSNYLPAATPIKIDLASRPESPAIVALCVIGKGASGVEQSFATLASWVWAPEFPSITDQIDLIEGNNEIKITPKAPSGNWLIVRSRDPLNAMPEDGKEYAVNQPLGNGTIVVAGPMAEFIDKTVKNEESWNYTFIAYNNARRFSLPLTKSMTLSKQQLLWVQNNLVQTGQMPVEARANNKRYVCRSRHTDQATGQSRGMQPGSMITPNNDLKAGNCFYEYGGTVYRSINYELLMTNKGSPTDLVRWARGAANATTTAIPNGSIVAGTDDTGATVGPNLYICLIVNAQNPGKAGTHMGGGCRSYAGNNNGTPIANVNFDVLAFK
jgi:hypothetical protein